MPAILMLWLVACTPLAAPTSVPLEPATTAELCGSPSGKALKIGVLPVLNTLPIFVAQQTGFYDNLGVNVEIIPVESARDRAIAADPEAYRANPIRMPDPLRPIYTIPQFAAPRVPTESEIQYVIDWIVDKRIRQQHSDL